MAASVVARTAGALRSDQPPLTPQAEKRAAELAWAAESERGKGWMSFPFLDTNVLLRHLRQDHPAISPKATAILSRIEAGQLKVRTASPDAVVDGAGAIGRAAVPDADGRGGAPRSAATNAGDAGLGDGYDA